MEPDNWHILKNFTHARIALGRAGNALPTKEILNFRMAHALAKDAVYSEMDIHSLKENIKELGLDAVVVQSMVANRNEYLLNPNKGKVLNNESIDILKGLKKNEFDLCMVIADGLSSGAVNKHAIKLIRLLIGQLHGWQIAPIVIAKQGRVAISDPIGEILQAKISLILIGERPGLSTPNSMGAYITYLPKPGNTDEKRNCVSNIQPDGMSYEFASAKIAYILQQIRALQLSGVKLKDDFDDSQIKFLK
jgi:ethanolamine ammonia-lyase small subunit